MAYIPSRWAHPSFEDWVLDRAPGRSVRELARDADTSYAHFWGVIHGRGSITIKFAHRISLVTGTTTTEVLRAALGPQSPATALAQDDPRIPRHLWLTADLWASQRKAAPDDATLRSLAKIEHNGRRPRMDQYHDILALLERLTGEK